MTHFLAAVVVPAETFERGEYYIEEYIMEVMAPYAEEADQRYMEQVVYMDKHECMKEAAGYILASGDDDARKLFQSGLYAHILLATGQYGGQINEDGCLTYLSNPNSFYDWYRFEKNFETIENNHVPIKDALHAMEGAIERNKYYRHAANILASQIAIPEKRGGRHPFGWGIIKREIGLTSEQYWQINDAIAERIMEYEWDVPFLVYILVTPDDWYNGKEYGWFGSSSKTMDSEEWEKTYVEVLQKHREDYLVFLDCHV